MRAGASVFFCLMLWVALPAKAQPVIDSTLAPKPLVTADSLSTQDPLSLKQPQKPGQVLAAIGAMIGAGLLVFLLYNVRSR